MFFAEKDFIMNKSKIKLSLLLIMALIFVIVALASCELIMQGPTASGDGTPMDGDPNCFHSWKNPVTLSVPTCGTKETGTVRYTCEKCGKEKETKTYPFASHDLVQVVVKKAECGSEGLIRNECKNCNYYKEYTTSALVHGYVLMAVPDGDGKCANMCPNCLEIDKYVDVVRYEDYGAVGDGITDDSAAIRAAHEAANGCGLSVEGKAGATYYIGRLSSTINIKTDTDWKGASFVFDDNTIKWNESGIRGVNVFTVAPDSSAKAVTVPRDFTLSKGQTNIGMSFGEPCMLKIENGGKKIYLRYGVNQNNGVNLHEMILIDEYGNVDPSTPIQYDYDAVTSITRFSVTDKPISVGNGKITTIAPNPKEYDPNYENNYCYFNRGIAVKRSNTTIYGIEHCIVGEDMTVEKDRNGDGIIDKWGADKSYGVPYSGFFAFNSCYNVLMRDCTVQGHQAYNFYQGTSRNEMGSYDLTATECVNLKLYKVVQYENKATGEVINNRFMYHGVMGSNFCRNMTMDECYVDRFDAHQGLHNAKITNTTLGFGILVIGGGELYIENVYRMAEMNGSGAFISLRSDYNSVFDGDVIIKNCRMDAAITCIVSGVWRSFYNGLPNYVTRSLMIDGLEILGNGKSTLNLYNISNASKDALVNTVNPLYVPESITVSNIRNSNGKDVTVRASKSSSDALSTISIIMKA